jgi:multicomponent Na+:H+ antiporter subunit E
MGDSKTRKAPKSRTSSGLVPSLFLALALYLFWIILSGKMEAKYLTIGFLSALIIALVTRPLLLVPFNSGQDSCRPLYDLPWLKLMVYFPWLVWQIVLANLQVAGLILNPKLPIEPQLVSFRKKLPGPVAHLTLANSITLTPGTITIELEDDKYLVHAIGLDAAQSLAPEQGEGDMPYRVGVVFEKGRK